jgi:hypothetical protein
MKMVAGKSEKASLPRQKSEIMKNNLRKIS